MPTSDDILRAIHLRFFRWVEQEWEEEIASNFKRISKIKSVETESFLSVLRALSLGDLKRLALSLNRSRPMGPRGLVGDIVGGVSAEEQLQIKRPLADQRAMPSPISVSRGLITP
jgi:hypothetical protein